MLLIKYKILKQNRDACIWNKVDFKLPKRAEICSLVYQNTQHTQRKIENEKNVVLM